MTRVVNERKNKDLVRFSSHPVFQVLKEISQVLVTVICMLAQARNEHASEFQLTIAIYLLACGASRSQFDVLNHAGLSLSYPSAIRKVKELGQERLTKILGLVRTQAFMLIWDNLNILFCVGEQRKDSKDHFDNGTTGMIIPLFGVPYGGLALDLLPPCSSHLPVLSFEQAKDVLPSLKEMQELEAAMLWHIEDILFDAFPQL
jgi:hypothetical protein